MEFSAQKIADLIQGEVVGNGSALVSGLSKIEEGKTGTLTFLANIKYEEHIYTTGASVAIVNDTFVPERALPESLTLVKVADAYACFAQLLDVYNKMQHAKEGIEDASNIHPTARVGEGVYIANGASVGENSVIGDNVKLYANCTIADNVKIGDDTLIFPNAVVLSGCEVGKSCTIHSSTVIGADGFGFAPNSEGQYNKVAQIGNVIVEDHVEIGANTTIDRATLGSTIIRKGVKLDNLIQIAHNCEIGENTVIAAQTGVAGSTKIGKNCQIGGQVGIVGHIEIADEVKIAAQSGIGHSVKEKGTILQGSPAFPIRNYKMSYVGFKRLPELMKEMDALKARLDALEK